MARDLVVAEDRYRPEIGPIGNIRRDGRHRFTQKGGVRRDVSLVRGGYVSMVRAGYRGSVVKGGAENFPWRHGARVQIYPSFRDSRFAEWLSHSTS